MTHPPRLAEAFLASLGAHSEFRDAVLGDLAEELALRAEWDGVRAARRWYCREAIRATPYLLRDWARRLSMRDVRALAGVVLTSYVFMLMLTLTVLAVARGVLGAAGLSSALEWIAQPDRIPLAVNFAFGSVAAMVGGYIAAWLHPRAPIVGALALGVVWSLVGVTAIALLERTPNPWTYLMPFVVTMGTLTGGALRARASASWDQIQRNAG